MKKNRIMQAVCMIVIAIAIICRYLKDPTIAGPLPFVILLVVIALAIAVRAIWLWRKGK